VIAAFGGGVSPGALLAAVFNCSSGDVACLIGAIHAANGNADADTIALEAGAYTLTAADNGDEPGGFNGLPVIISPLTIQGAGATTTVIQRNPTAPNFRILLVAAAGDLRLDSITIRDGFLGEGGGGGAGIHNLGATTIANGVVTNNHIEVAGPGAGIFNEGTLKLVESRVEFNFAAAARVGGIASSRTMTIDRSMINNNGADLSGGIRNSGVAVITGSTIAFNASQVGHSGIVNETGAMLTISNSAIARNGGGIENRGSATITNCTFARNVLTSFSGGGAAIRNSGTMDVKNTTVAGSLFASESGQGHGGGILNEGGTIGLQNTILAGNTVVALDGVPLPGPDCFGNITSLGHNLVGDPSDCGIPLLGSDLTGDPGLDVFADDGTPGNGHFPLLAESQAIDAGDPAACSLTDQLGHSRIDGDGDSVAICDMGSIEFSPPATIVNGLVELAPLVTAFQSTPAPGAPAGTFLITATFRNTSASSIHDPFFQVATLSGGNQLLNADGGPAAVGAIRTPDAGTDAMLSPDETLTVQFVIGLQARARFTFLIDLLGVPGP
jgi:hypothetical protein